MEIPAIKIELYEQSKERFAQEIYHALRTTSVAQVSGLEQQLVHDLYGYMQEHAEELAENFHPFSDLYLGKDFYRQNFFSHHFGIKPHILRKIPYLNRLVKEVRKNVSAVRNKVTPLITSLYGLVRKPQQLFLFRYYKNPGFFIPRRMMVEKHADEHTLVFAASASAAGLEGKIKGRWTPIQPESGHLLVLPGKGLESQSQGEIKALWHRVQYPTAERWALLYV
ncbi:MAG: 2OG-Fe(II) oxygenase family protein [Nanoarchaeota archaeon]|nr:2OG-Fe(II) oxygenase family protein [Nanoarchaeota archaeon]